MARGPWDKHALYEASVQDPESEIAFFERVFKSRTRRRATRLREDFCGTGNLACTWARQGGHALGLDLHGPTLRWGRERHVAALDDAAAARVELAQCDVLEGHKRRFAPEIVVAMNFSYFVFKERALLARYFDSVRRSLAPGGIFVLDLLGGPEAQVAQVETTEHDGFDYEWEQAKYNPITGEYLCYIHFELHPRGEQPGRRLERAFRYDWRLWTLPELRDLLREVGFGSVDVYWEGTNADGDGGNGVFRKSVKGDDSEAWIAYIVCGADPLG